MMNSRIRYILLSALLTIAATAAELDVSKRETGIKHRLTVRANDVVIVRTVQGPTAVLRFISLTETNASFTWCYLAAVPETRCSDIETVPLTEIPRGQKRPRVPQAEAQIRAGDILVTLSRSTDGKFGLVYYRENAGLDLLPDGLPQSARPPRLEPP